MTNDAEKRRFTVISNPILNEEKSENYEKEKYKKKRIQTYQTNPLKEQFMRFTNKEKMPI